MTERVKKEASAKEGREVLKAYRHKRPVRDVVVLDLRTSRKSRSASCRDLRALNPAVIMVFSEDAKEKRSKSVEIHARRGHDATRGASSHVQCRLKRI